MPGTARLGDLRITAVDAPSQKVFMHDNVDRYSRTQLYFGFKDANVTVLMYDLSAAQRITDDSNVGWNPRLDPSSNEPLNYQFVGGSQWEPQARAGSFVDGHYRWTRGGLKGIDFGGSEIDTGQDP